MILGRNGNRCSEADQDLQGNNICSRQLRRGDVEQGFRQADFVFEDVHSPAAQHVALRPRQLLVLRDKLTI
jgi:hypothetical protein